MSQSLKRKVTIVALLATIMSCQTMAAGGGYTYTPFDVSTVTTSLPTILAGESSGTDVGSSLESIVDLKIEMQAVKNDARHYLAGGEMSDNLQSVIYSVEQQAKTKNLPYLINNPQRIAYEITKL